MRTVKPILSYSVHQPANGLSLHLRAARLSQPLAVRATFPYRPIMTETVKPILPFIDRASANGGFQEAATGASMLFNLALRPINPYRAIIPVTAVAILHSLDRQRENGLSCVQRII